MAPIQGVAAASAQSGVRVRFWTLCKAAAGSATLMTKPPRTFVALSGRRFVSRRQTPIPRDTRIRTMCCMAEARRGGEATAGALCRASLKVDQFDTAPGCEKIAQD